MDGLIREAGELRVRILGAVFVRLILIGRVRRVESQVQTERTILVGADEFDGIVSDAVFLEALGRHA
jgi:hypothetical protein